MSIPSLPNYPAPQRTPPAPDIQKRGLVLPPRAVRVLLGLALLGCVLPVALVLYEFATASPGEPPQPLDFKLVEERHARVGYGVSRERVEGLLGPPTERYMTGGAVWEWEQAVMQSGRHHELPVARSWDKWADPKDPNRWVAVLYVEEGVYDRINSKRFDPRRNEPPE